MTTMTFDEVTQVVHRDLVRRQLSILCAGARESPEAQQARLADYYLTGLAALRRLLDTSDVSPGLISACWDLVETDERFGFIGRLPTVAAFGGAAGSAVGRAVVGETSQEASDLTTLINVSITLLDGLIDEAPDLFNPEEDRIAALLCEGFDQQRHDVNAPSARELDGKHPAVAITYHVILEWMGRIMGSKGWGADPSFREALTQAVEGAFRAEIEAARGLELGSNLDLDDCHRRLAAKSANAVLVVGMASLSMRGWPRALDRVAFQDAMLQIGRYFGWIDDVSDVLADLDAGRWNQVLLTTIEDRTGWTKLDARELREYLRTQIADERIAERIIRRGRREYDEAQRRLTALEIDTLPLTQLMSDATQSWLGGGS